MKGKLLCFIIAILSITKSASAQHPDSLIRKFQGSFIKNFNYPNRLKDNCLATFTTVKIEIDAKGSVNELSLSDSADPLFNAEFIVILSKLDKAAIEQFAARKKLSNNTLLMPVTYSVTKCSLPSINPRSVTNAFRFNQEDFRGNATILPPLSHVVIEESSH